VINSGVLSLDRHHHQFVDQNRPNVQAAPRRRPPTRRSPPCHRNWRDDGHQDAPTGKGHPLRWPFCPSRGKFHRRVELQVWKRTYPILTERAAFTSSLTGNFRGLHWTLPGCNGGGVRVALLSISDDGASVCEADGRFPCEPC